MRGVFYAIFISFSIFALIGGLYFESSTVPKTVSFSINPGLTRSQVAGVIGSELNWDTEEKKALASTYAQMQWIAFSDILEEIFAERFDWNEQEREVFMTSSARYLDSNFDFLSTVHASSTYNVRDDVSPTLLASALVDRTLKDAGEDLSGFISNNLNEKAVLNIAEFVQNELELLPDLLPLPPQDLSLKKNEAGDVLLAFSTSYYNQGKGPLELIADPETTGIRKDIERNVFQRIYDDQGGFRDKLVGTFLWHQSHLHYHFADFIIYDLEAVDVPGNPDLSGVRSKSTFCVRDTSKIGLTLENTPEKAGYLICGKERQGISVGWADTYFYNYPDQNLNLGDLPSGIYKLSFVVNPENWFDELRNDNNKSSVVIELNMEKMTVKILEEDPKTSPAIEHIYYDQVFD